MNDLDRLAKKLIVELRELAKNWPLDAGWPSTGKRLAEAADEIERLQTELQKRQSSL